MKRFLLIAALVLAGCETTPVEQLSYSQQKALAQKIIDRCVAQGVSVKSREMDRCARSELDREVAVRNANRERAANIGPALGAGLSTYGQSLQQSGANRPMNCTTTPRSTFVGGTPSSYSTTCY